MERDQKGASEVYYKLVKSGRPLPEMLREAVRIHGPYTHVPYHERMDDGYVNFVNNDHCLLSARATLHLSRMLPGAASGLPMAQTIWYIPTGLDIWNQKIGKAPGHYSRGMQVASGPPPAPVVHWPDQQPLALDGPLKERLGRWATLVHRGQVIDAYCVFLGLMENPAERQAALAELAFAGLIAACLVLAKRFSSTGETGWKRMSRATGVFYLVAFAGIAMGSNGSGAVRSTVIVLFSAAVVAGWAWIAAISARLTTDRAHANATTESADKRLALAA